MKTNLKEQKGSPPTSEIISEVGQEPKNGNATTVEGAITPDQAATLLIEEVIKIGAEFKPAHEKLKNLIEKHRDKVLAVKEAFGVRQGCAGNSLIIDNKPFTWEEFVEIYFGVTSRRLNQLLESKDTSRACIRVVAIPETEKRLYKKGKAAGMAEAERAMNARRLATPVPVVAAVNTAGAKNEVYAYFYQLKDEKQTFSFELAAMVLEVYDTVDAEEISKLFVKEIKKQQADARKASVNAATA